MRGDLFIQSCFLLVSAVMNGLSTRKVKKVGSEAFRQEGIESSERNTDYGKGGRGIQAMEEPGFNQSQSSIFNS